jgi:N-acetylmuramoyl-L-alanine amidase
MTDSPRSPHPEPDSRHAAKVFASPNHGERRQAGGPRLTAPDMLILHYTGMENEGEALQWLCNPVSQVSCHYFVFGNGHIVQLVPEARRAWHAGVSGWAGETDINSASIGIEIAHPGHKDSAAPDNPGPESLQPFTDIQLNATLQLCRDIVGRHSIQPGRVLAHSDIAPGRKRDPGELFPWRMFAEAGVGLWAEPAPVKDGRFLAPGEEGQPVSALQAMFAMFGYELAVTGVYDQRLFDVVTAFQRHWRTERIDGIADASTITTLRDLIRATEGERVG